MENAGGRYYYHYDGLGSVTALSDASGNLTESYSYDIFGGVRGSLSGVGNPYYFTGRQYDSETGLYYYRARYYDARIGRFLQTDPIGYTGGINLYTYVGNNPINFIDPMGLDKGPYGYTRPFGDTIMNHILSLYFKAHPEKLEQLKALAQIGGPLPPGIYNASWGQGVIDWLKRVFEGSQVGAGTGAKVKVKLGPVKVEAGAHGMEIRRVTREGVESVFEEYGGASVEIGPVKGEVGYRDGEYIPPKVSVKKGGLSIKDMTTIEVGGTIPDPTTGNAVNIELHVHPDEAFKFK